MSPREAPLPDTRSRWSRRHPRTVAFLVFFLVDTAVAALLSRLVGDPYTSAREAWLTSWLLLEPFAILAGVVALPFYGPWLLVRDHHTRNQAVFRGCIVGFLLVPLTVLFRALWDLVFDPSMRSSAMGMIHRHDYSSGMEMSALYVTAAMMYSLLLPEISGAFAGFMIWRLIGGDRE